MEKVKIPVKFATMEWDWKDEIEVSDLNEATSNGLVFFSKVYDTGGDYYALVATKSQITPELAQWLFEQSTYESEDIYIVEDDTSNIVILTLNDDHSGEVDAADLPVF